MAQQWAERLCLRLVHLLRKVRRRSSWDGPTCSCKDFRQRGKCKHLEAFARAAKEDEEASGSAHGTRGGAGSSLRETLLSKKRSRRRTGAPASEGSTASDGSRDDEGRRRGSRRFVLASTKLALSNAPARSLGEARVPAGVKRLGGTLEDLDLLRRDGDGRCQYRAVSSVHGVVLTKVLRCEPPSCLPHHQDTLNNELEILARLRPHANVASFLGYSEAVLDNDVLERRVAFQFCVDSLGDLVQHRSTADARLTFLEVRKYSLDVCEALDYLHSQGVVHRNLTSDNVVMAFEEYPGSGNWTSAMKKHFRLSGSLKSLFGAEARSGTRSGMKKARSIGWRSRQPSSQPPAHLAPFQEGSNSLGPTLTAKVTNFEVAKRIDRRRTATRVSSPLCMAPEMWQSESYGYGVDVWAVGMLLLEMLAREKQLAKLNLAQVESAVCSRAFPRRVTLAPPEFKPFEDLMRKCLVHDQAARIPLTELISALRNAL